MAYYAFQHFTVRFPPEHQHVAHVEINRPDKMNAFFEAMWLELSQIFTQLSTDSSARAIVLSGAGDRAFTTGLDVKAASQGLLSGDAATDPARKAAHLRRHIASFQDCISAVERCEKPVVVAMHGFSLGLAIDLSTAADVRVCARNVRFAVKEVDIGIAADVGTLSRLPKVVGHYGWVKEVALTAREFGADEALRVGFVNAVYDTREATIVAALELAAYMATKSPVAVQGTKEILNWSRDHSVQDGLRYTTVWNSAALQTQDMSAALMSGLQKRTPTFEKL
ncbi:enoyl-CoA hydratase/isomerase family protein [Penicillium alfredii]|uniref:Enoyl-CoA hydratase/isomerase family protein n=1 Tax=Penicillium alfredii TaxID=1506179 RepID=A0A9W9KGW6_9EURO|nr:enoyl-CoA hydratase/isomerase family protein [Penicillium alfredii]KAJ5106079.1 enoyl-CoA hydratase/isomerase family protein [Penicillium alfredii]